MAVHVRFLTFEAQPAPTISLASDLANFQELNATILVVLQDHAVSLSRQNITELFISMVTMLQEKFGQHFVVLQMCLPA